jgi:hypothetical protein
MVDSFLRKLNPINHKINIQKIQIAIFLFFLIRSFASKIIIKATHTIADLESVIAIASTRNTT